ncbi:epsin-3 isoform X2 [Brachyhypopomus gauderio]|uniref:epsin-3 isoform X2 n=1 Tax=Brachyhypopomus gauderio TaxID=698409 RepID=UPI0040422ABD
MTTSALRRQVKNIVHNYSEAEVKVREATSNDPWGPSSSLMSEIADLTFSVVAFSEVMAMVWKRLNDHGKNWRHVYKALTLLDYLAKTGSERVAQQCRENAFAIQTLRDFQYVDRDGRDQGVNVREKAKQLVALLRDEERLRQERAQALKTRERMAAGGGTGSGGGAGPPAYPARRSSQPSMAALYGEEFSRSRGSPSSYNSSTSSPRASELEQSRPQTSGEEELQLQLALAMSREQRSRQGDESELQKVLEESRRESESGPEESAMTDLVDIFGPTSETPNDEPWQAQPTCSVNSDPWESIAGVKPSTPVIGSPWTARPTSSSPSQPWGASQSPPDVWDAPPTNSSPIPSEQAWGSLGRPASARPHPFSFRDDDRPVDELREEGPNFVFSPRSESPADVDPFAELVGGRQLNGRSGGSPETFDICHLGPPLEPVAPRMCRTPEAFLGPTAASLVNLDTLIPPNPLPKSRSKNPFLSVQEEEPVSLRWFSGLSTPSPTNPFHCEQPRLTLNQMRPRSASPLLAPGVGGALTCSASLPQPLQQQPRPLRSSHTQPPHGHPDMPANLPQPLLPFTSTPATPTPPCASPLPRLQDRGRNPFL